MDRLMLFRPPPYPFPRTLLHLELRLGDEDVEYAYIAAMTQLRTLCIYDSSNLIPVLKKSLATDVAPLLSLTELGYVDLRDTRAANADLRL